MYLILISCTFATIFIYLYRWFTFWQRQGIKTIWSFFFVNINEYYQDTSLRRMKELGKVYAIHLPYTRALVINDPDMIREAFVLNGDHFRDRVNIHMGMTHKTNRMLAFLNGDHNWKRLRKLLTRTFTSAKLKAMVPCIIENCDRFSAEITKCTGNSINIQKNIALLNLDILGECVFGVKIDSLNNPDHPFAMNAKEFFEFDANWRRLISVTSPKLAKFLKVEFFKPIIIEYFGSLVDKIIIERKSQIESMESQAKVSTDFIKSMIDCEEESVQEDNGSQTCPLTISRDEMIAQGTMLFFVGYDTTSNTMAHLVYHLAANTDCQQILYEEIKQLTDFSYESLSQLKYLNAVIKEVLRLSPSVLAIIRKATRDITIRGIKIPAGTFVDVSPYALHRHPDYWTDPEKFNPDRFIQENEETKYAFLPFGTGLRSCIGDRFILYQMLIFTAKIFSRLEFTLDPGYNMEYFKGNFFLTPKHLWVEINLRKL